MQAKIIIEVTISEKSKGVCFVDVIVNENSNGKPDICGRGFELPENEAKELFSDLQLLANELIF